MSSTIIGRSNSKSRASFGMPKVVSFHFMWIDKIGETRSEVIRFKADDSPAKLAERRGLADGDWIAFPA